MWGSFTSALAPFDFAQGGGYKVHAMINDRRPTIAWGGAALNTDEEAIAVTISPCRPPAPLRPGDANRGSAALRRGLPGTAGTCPNCCAGSGLLGVVAGVQDGLAPRVRSAGCGASHDGPAVR